MMAFTGKNEQLFLIFYPIICAYREINKFDYEFYFIQIFVFVLRINMET